MSFFKKILISTEMSSKIEVIVPKHRADNSPRMHTWEEFCEDLFLRVSPERHGDITGWKSGYTNNVNKDFLEVFLFCCENVSTIKWAIILSHFNRWETTEMSLIISTNSFLFQSWPSFVFLSITPCFFSVNSQAPPGTSLPLIIWRLIAYPYLARCSWFNDESTIQPSKLLSPPLNFDSIGLSNFPVNAWNVFLHTFFSWNYTGESWEWDRNE